MTALTELEKDRQKRIEQNRKRMAEALGSMDQYALLMWAQTANSKKRAPKPAAPRRAVADEDKRRSDRVRQLPAPTYNELEVDRRIRTQIQDHSRAERGPKRAAHPDALRGQRACGKGGWSSDLGDCSLAAAEAATSAALELASRLEVMGRTVTVKLMSYSQVAPGFWMNVPKDLASQMPHKASKTYVELASDARPVMMDGSTPQMTREVRPGVWRVVWLVKAAPQEGVGLSGGWAGFSKDQLLSPSDTIVFEKEGPFSLRAHVFRGSDYETAATAPQGMPACVLSLRGIRATPALAASLAACRAEGPAGAAEGSGEGSSASGQQLSGLEAGQEDGQEEEAPVEEAHGGEQQADEEEEEEEEEGEEEVCQEERQGKSRRRGDATAAVARMRHERIDQAGGGGSAVGRGEAAPGDDAEGRAGNQGNGDEARRDVRGQDQGVGAAGGRKKRARAKSGGGGDKSAKRTCSGGKRGRGSQAGGDGTVEDEKEEDAEEERGFPGATPQQQAEADRAWAAGVEVAVRSQSVPEKTEEEERLEASTDNFFVKCIRGYRMKRGRREYLVNWWFFSAAWDTWEPRAMLNAPPAKYDWALPMPRAVAKIK